MNQLVKPELKEGEIYAGDIINPDGTGNHYQIHQRTNNKIQPCR